MKALVDNAGDRVIGFSTFGAEAGDVMASFQVAMIAGLPFTALRDAIFTHPTMAEGSFRPSAASRQWNKPPESLSQN